MLSYVDALKSLNWAGSVLPQNCNPSLVQLGLKMYWDIQAELGLGLEGSGISELSLAWAQTKLRVPARLGLGLNGILFALFTL